MKRPKCPWRYSAGAPCTITTGHRHGDDGLLYPGKVRGCVFVAADGGLCMVAGEHTHDRKSPMTWQSYQAPVTNWTATSGGFKCRIEDSGGGRWTWRWYVAGRHGAYVHGAAVTRANAETMVELAVAMFEKVSDGA